VQPDSSGKEGLPVPLPLAPGRNLQECSLHSKRPPSPLLCPFLYGACAWSAQSSLLFRWTPRLGTCESLQSQCPVPGCSLVPEESVYLGGSPPPGLLFYRSWYGDPKRFWLSSLYSLSSSAEMRLTIEEPLQVAVIRVVFEVRGVDGEEEWSQNGSPCCRRPGLTHTPVSSHTVDGWWGSPGSMQWGGGPPRSAPACPPEAKAGWCWRHWRSRRTWLSQCFQPFPC